MAIENENSRNSQLTLRVTRPEKVHFRREATRRGKTESELLRELIGPVLNSQTEAAAAGKAGQ